MQSSDSESSQLAFNGVYLADPTQVHTHEIDGPYQTALNRLQLYACVGKCFRGVIRDSVVSNQQIDL